MIRSLLLLALAPLLCAQAPPLPVDTLPEDLASRAVPEGLPQSLEPLSAPWLALGRRLFFDPILSLDRRVSCASCHEPEHGFSSPERFPLGIQGRRATRHAPSILNRRFGRLHSWDGRAETLEAQMLMPIVNENEMGLDLAVAVRRLLEDDAYHREFAPLGGDPTGAALARALATFVSSLMLGDSPVDRFRASQAHSLTRQEVQGLWIYESKGRCWECHSGPNFTDERFHSTGIGVTNAVPESGRFSVTSLETDRGAFKTPTLRGLTATAPYMHDGSLDTLEDVVAYYRRGGNAHPQRDPLLRPLDLSDDESAALLAFLRALSRIDPTPQ